MARKLQLSVNASITPSLAASVVPDTFSFRAVGRCHAVSQDKPLLGEALKGIESDWNQVPGATTAFHVSGFDHCAYQLLIDRVGRCLETGFDKHNQLRAVGDLE